MLLTFHKQDMICKVYNNYEKIFNVRSFWNLQKFKKMKLKPPRQENGISPKFYFPVIHVTERSKQLFMKKIKLISIYFSFWLHLLEVYIFYFQWTQIWIYYANKYGDPHFVFNFFHKDDISYQINLFQGTFQRCFIFRSPPLR